MPLVAGVDRFLSDTVGCDYAKFDCLETEGNKVCPTND